MTEPADRSLRGGLLTRLAFTTVLLIMFSFMILVVLVIRGESEGLRNQIQDLPIISHLIKERDKVVKKADLQTLNLYIPSFDYLANFIKTNQKEFDPQRLGQGYDSYLVYYQKTLEISHEKSPAHAMLGFCYFYLNDYTSALQHYTDAARLSPEFFFNHYNQAILWLKTGQWANAKAAFNRALSVSPATTLQQLMNYRIYLQILSSLPREQLDRIPQNISVGYTDTQKLIALIEMMEKNNEYNNAFIESLQVRIF